MAKIELELKPIVIFWTRNSDYMMNFLNEFVKLGFTVHLFLYPPSQNAPYQHHEKNQKGIVFYDSSKISVWAIIQHLKTISPSVVLVSSWNSMKYMTVLKLYKTRLIMCMDNQWDNNLRQKIGVLLWKMKFFPNVDFFLLPGDRQAIFARKLGSKTDGFVRGLYSSVFTDESRVLDFEGRKKEFFFVGRLVSEKGIQFLLEAYSQYRNSVLEPWGLKIAGTGPLRSLCLDVPGIRMLGFLSSKELEGEYKTAGAFVLPSVFEPWGVVVHDATCFGLPLILSSRVGAGDDLLVNNFNGFKLEGVSVNLILEALLRIHNLEQSQYQEFSKNSFLLSSKYDASITCHDVLQKVKQVQNE